MSAIIKKVPVDIKVEVIALRRSDGDSKSAVKKFTYFTERLDDVVYYVLNIHLTNMEYGHIYKKSVQIFRIYLVPLYFLF